MGVGGYDDGDGASAYASAAAAVTVTGRARITVLSGPAEIDVCEHRIRPLRCDDDGYDYENDYDYGHEDTAHAYGSPGDGGDYAPPPTIRPLLLRLARRRPPPGRRRREGRPRDDDDAMMEEREDVNGEGVRTCACYDIIGHNTSLISSCHYFASRDFFNRK